MRRLLCLLFALLLTHSDRCNTDIRYCVVVVMQDHSSYTEYMNPCYLELMVRDFCCNECMESIFITRDLCVIDQ